MISFFSRDLVDDPILKNQQTKLSYSSENQPNPGFSPSDSVFLGLLESAPDAIVIVDQSGNIVLVNNQTERIFGYQRHELLGRPVELLMPERFQERHRMHRSGYIADPKTRPMGACLDLMARRKDGTEFPVDVSLSPMMTEKGILVTSIIRDITDRKKAEAVLRESKERFHTLARVSPVGIFESDTGGRYLYVNERWCEIAGVPYRDSLGEGWTRALHPADRPHILEQWKRSAAQGLPFKAEYRFQQVDGSIRWVYAQATALKGDEGAILGYVGTITDITEQKSAEQELLSLNRFLNAILSSTKEAIFTISPDRIVLSCNQAAIDMLGYPEEEIIGCSTAKFYTSQEAFLDFGRNVVPALRQKGSFTGEFELKRANGEVFPAEFMVNALKLGESELGVVAVIRDITDRKRAERALLKMNEELERRVQERTTELAQERDRAQRYLDVAAVMLVAIGTDQKVTLVNKKGCEILGYEEKEIIGKNWFDHFLPERIRGEVRSVFLRLLAGDIEPSKYYENPVLTREGKERLIAWHNTVLRDENGRIYATLSSGEDITEKAELQRQVQQAEKLASIGQFTAGLAHEIGTPLNVIMGRAEYILRRIPPEDSLRSSLESIINQIERITKIVQQLLSFARPKPPELRPVRLHSLLYDVLGFFEHQVTRQGITLAVNCPDGLPEVRADQDQIQQVLFNIILNALQAMPQGGSLHIHVSRTIPRQDREDPVGDGFLKIEITDSGPGIPEEELQKIFDPFFSTKGVGKGTGLGLTVSYGIMKAHRGWIRVKSQVGRGTTFGLYLPLGSDSQLVDTGAPIHG